MRIDRQKRTVVVLAVLTAMLGLHACADEASNDNGTEIDSGAHADDGGGNQSDAGDLTDSGEPDSGQPDSGEPDAGQPDSGEPTPEPSLPPVSAVSTLPNISAADYAHNRWGLIEASTLEAYVTSWATKDSAAAAAAPNGRPAHLPEGAKLIVLQLNAANRAAGENYVPSSPANGVYTYELDAFRFNETRDTGLISNSVRYQASGPTADAWLASYGIDLSRDFVVFAAGENAAPNGGFFQDLTRAVYWLRYWGAAIDQLAILNGTLKQNYLGALSTTKTPEGSISNGGFSVADLRVDNTNLTISLEAFLKAVDQNLAATNAVHGFTKQWIIDARPTAQYNRTTPTAAFFDTHPGQFITTAWNSTGAPSHDATGQAKSYVPFEGHVKGATSFPWADLLVDAGAGNWKYKDKATLADVFEAAGYAPADKATKVIISQCRTNFEVQVNGFAALNILGYPTVYFDGSLVEYFSLVSAHPEAAWNLKPTDAAYQFRTDIPARSQHYTASDNSEAPSTTENDSGVVAYNVSNGAGASDRKASQAVLNRGATTTRKALDADREYKRR